MANLDQWRIEAMFKVGTPQPADSTFYHYTSAGAAMNILKSGRFWFTERRHLNDPSEIVHSLGKVRGVLNGHNELASAFDKAVNEEMDRSAFYIASFSSEPNDLSQWRCYADDGCGVALGFSFKEFGTCRDQRVNFTRHRHIVSYGDDNFLKKITEITESAIKLIGQNYSPNDVAIELSRVAVFAGLMNKHVAYEHEKEIRFLFWAPADMNMTLHTHDGMPCIHWNVRERNGELVRYLDVPIPAWKENSALAHIWVGPAAAAGTEDCLRTLCEQLGITKPGLKIERSLIPYRSTR